MSKVDNKPSNTLNAYLLCRTVSLTHTLNLIYINDIVHHNSFFMHVKTQVTQIRNRKRFELCFE